VADKIIVCRCEDVTLGDLRRALATGFTDLEEVKRYTGFGTGPCQGKECLRTVALLIAEQTGRPAHEVAPFTSRPPLVPTPLVLLAGTGAAATPPEGARGAGPADPEDPA
jgi:bacterioferritin-associated ferredoxin